MKIRFAGLLALSIFLVLGSVGCATKKYARNRVNERMTPLEQRAGSLEETSRRNTQDIGQLNTDVTDVRGRADRAQSQADAALSRANEANTRAGSTDQSVNDLRNNIDKYSVQNTASVNFKFDSYQLTPEARTSLDQLAGQIRDRENFILEIEGFADATGTDQYNNQLTQRRAAAVQRYLAEQHNIPLFRMRILGFGEVRPVADNHSREGRAQNRRVEIRLMTRSVSSGTASKSAASQE
ncbi:MAG TPA: OmpA family protein [Blastocatellia bacterium]|nr:OmpA family protein [Blastocatellia bacterium]